MQKEILIQELSKFAVPGSASFQGFPATAELASHSWANALAAYYADIFPITTQLASGISILESSLVLSLETNGFQVIAQSLAQCLSIFATGMTGFVALPPQSPLLIPGDIYSDSGEAIEYISTQIDTWSRLGTATNIQTGATINWS